MEKLNEVLLIDDSKGTNALNQRLIREMGVASKTTTLLNGELALNYLFPADNLETRPNPDLIFLDINMPVMDGYQFLEKYKSMADKCKKELFIVMLTTSIREIDRERAKNYKTVLCFQTKPLTIEKVNQILEQIA